MRAGSSRAAVALAAAAAAALAGRPGEAASCDVAVRPVNFGVVDLRRTTLSNGRVTVTCNKTVSFVATIEQGPGGGDRFLRGPRGEYMLYKLFRDATYTIEWGDHRTSAPGVPGVSDGRRPVELTIHGALPAQSGFGEGTYVDSLLVTLLF